MAKKYLSLEEAAAQLKMETDELVRLREKGSIRGFADRGTWKFREDDVKELLRSRQADSDPDVPLLDSEDEKSDSAIVGDDTIGEQPTVISKTPPSAGDEDLIAMDSDSDVKLVVGGSDLSLSDSSDSGLLGTDPESGLGLGGGSLDQDSDTKSGSLAPESELSLGGLDGGSGTDMEARLVGDSLDSDSDVALVSDSSGDIELSPLDDQLSSDSDVRLVTDDGPNPGSDSDVKLVGADAGSSDDSDSDVALLSNDEQAIALDFSTSDDESASVLSDESGIALSGDDSSMLLEAESGISLEGPSDSGVALEGDDEGITLDIGGDSGISLETTADSGISLESVADSGISLEDSNEFGGTVPMMKAIDEPEGEETAYEIPKVEDSSQFELAALEDADDGTDVFDLDEAEDVGDDAVFDLDEAESMDDLDEFDDFGDEDLDVADDILGEDDELDDLDVFDADDDVFDDDMAGASQQYASPVGAAVEQEWGAGTFVGLLFSSALLVVTGIVMFDLVNNIWSWSEPSAPSSMLLDMLGGLYK